MALHRGHDDVRATRPAPAGLLEHRGRDAAPGRVPEVDADRAAPASLRSARYPWRDAGAGAVAIGPGRDVRDVQVDVRELIDEALGEAGGLAPGQAGRPAAPLGGRGTGHDQVPGPGFVYRVGDHRGRVAAVPN